MNKETARVEAFSDGVFAIAITLLVLDLKVPPTMPAGLRAQLLRQWPTYVAFFISFAFIGIMWINHHRLFNLIHRSNNTLMILNLALLLGVTFVPYPTSVLANQLRGGDSRTAALFFNGTFVAIAIVFNVLWHYCASKDGHMLGPAADRTDARRISTQYAVGPVAYFVCLLLGLWSVAVSLTLEIALAIFFALPPHRSVKLLGKPE